MAPILTGSQGLLKSSGIMAMSPSSDFFKKFDLSAHDADQSRKMRGCLVGEFDEMRGLTGRGAEEIRSFMTKRWETWTPKYQEYETTFPRRLLFHGSANGDEILADPEGERRWLPMRCLDMVDVARIEADRLQLWAEGLALWTADGVRWREAERLAKDEHEAFKITDEWDAPVARWLSEIDVGGKTPVDRCQLKAADVLIGALGFEVGKIGRADQMRVAKCMAKAGLRKVVTKVVTDTGPRTVKVWVRA
jgi:predicted P-loop ATPase